MHLQTDRGVIQNLYIVSTKKNILYSPRMKESASISAILFGIAGMAGAAAQTAANADGGADDVDMYAFDLNGVRYAGVTRKATFRNGDEIDLVYEERDGGREVFGVRRPATRSMWLYPYMSCGSTAAVFRGISQWLKWGTCFAAVPLAIGCVASLANDRGLLTLKEFGYVTGGTFGLLLLCSTWLLPRLYRFARAADEVFAAMGYEHPTRVDLHKTSKAYRKKNDVLWSMENYAELWY